MMNPVPILLFVILSLGSNVVLSVPLLDGRIVGGVPVKIEDYPYQVSYQLVGIHVCGASIIGQNKILTAAHCTNTYDASLISIRHSSSLREQGGVVIKVAKIAQHPNYDPPTYNIDVSVLTLVSDIGSSSIAKPIPLVDPGTPEGQRTGISTGWGRLTEEGEKPSQLQAVTLNEVKRGLCNLLHLGIIKKEMICFAAPLKDTCQGDSGGPLVVDGVQIGIISFGRGCADPRFPGVNTNIAVLRDFIDSNLA